MRRIVSFLVPLVLVLGACSTTGSDGYDPPAAAPATPDAPTDGDRGSAAAPRDLAPGFAVTTFTGDRFALAEQRGTPVVLNFWESW